MNKVILMGRLTRDPETRYSQSAEPLAISRYTLAVNRTYKREGQPDADFLNCIAFGRNGEFAEKFLKKGMMILVEASIRNNNWTDKEGQKRYDLEIIVDQHYFAESRATSEARRSFETPPVQESNIPPSSYAQQSQQSQQPPSPPPQSSGFSPIAEDIDDDDLPF